MKASEVLKRYAAGERNFCHLNLRGQSFKGQDLSEANFSNADIRGADFSSAILIRANFSNAKAGIEHRWFINVILVIVLLVLSTLSKSVTVVMAVTVTAAAYITFFASKYGDTTKNTIFLTVASALTIFGLFTLILTIFFYVTFTTSISLSILQTGLIPIAFALVGLLCAALFGSESGIISAARDKVEAGAIPLLIAVADEFLKNAITTTGGTSFHNANLADANFQQATLEYTNFRKANIYRAKWFQVQKLDRARVWRIYLQNPKVRKLLTTAEIQDKNFDGLNLRGINLSKVNLIDTSFIGTDLSEANLQDANLSRAILKQTQLDATDFTGATLTGAYIEDWGITNETNFRGVRCKYVYMRLPTKENPNPLRKPDNEAEVFTDGEFGDFIKPIVDTLDLYHNQGVDPRAIAVAFKELAENNPSAELEIVAIEKRGEDKILLRAKTATTANKSELSKEYFINYNQLKALAEKEVQALMSEKDGRIRSLENFVNTALQCPSYYAQRDINMSGDVRNIDTDGGNYNEDIEGDYNQ